MQLSEHFTLEEMTQTKTDLINVPSQAALENLHQTCTRMEEVRKLLGHPIQVHSGYRSEEVNKAVGGSKTSAHMDGDACDFICPEFGTPYAIAAEISESEIDFDQLILEKTWVHISFNNRFRRETLTNLNGNMRKGLMP